MKNLLPVKLRNHRRTMREKSLKIWWILERAVPAFWNANLEWAEPRQAKYTLRKSLDFSKYQNTFFKLNNKSEQVFLKL